MNAEHRAIPCRRSQQVVGWRAGTHAPRNVLFSNENGVTWHAWHATCSPSVRAQRRPQANRMERRCFMQRRSLFVRDWRALDRRKEMQVILNDVLGMIVTLGPLVALFVYQERVDRRQREAWLLRAEIDARARRVLHGDTMIGIDVDLPTAFRAGQVRLSTPSGYESMLGLTSGAVMSRVPNGYDVIIHCGGGA